VVGLDPGLGPETEVLAHCAGTRRGCVPSGKVVGTSPSCSRAMVRGLEKRVLDGVKRAENSKKDPR
jgi:hypothetical protein